MDFRRARLATARSNVRADGGTSPTGPSAYRPPSASASPQNLLRLGKLDSLQIDDSDLRYLIDSLNYNMAAHHVIST